MDSEVTAVDVVGSLVVIDVVDDAVCVVVSTVVLSEVVGSIVEVSVWIQKLQLLSCWLACVVDVVDGCGFRCCTL